MSSSYHSYKIVLDCSPSAGFLILEGDRIAHHRIEGVLVGDVRQLWPGGKNTSYWTCKWWTNAHIYLGSWLIFGSLRSIIMHLIQIERWPKMMEGSTYFGCSSSSFSFLRLAGAFLKKLSAGGTVLNVQQQKVPHSWKFVENTFAFMIIFWANLKDLFL